MNQDYKNQFPILKNHPGLIYLDSSATSLKPASVLEAERMYGTHFGTNATRGLYPLAEKTSALLDEARVTLANFLHSDVQEIIFTPGTTGAINALAYSLEKFLTAEKGSILVGSDAHHSLILPWTELAHRKNWTIKTTALKESGEIDNESILTQITDETHVVLLTLVSNVYGVINPLESLVQKIREKNQSVFILVDAVQAVAHIPLDIQNLGVDALVFSGHKLYGPTGVGVLYLNKNWQERLAPSQFGGGMVLDTSTTPITWKTGVEKFEAGTLPLAQIFGLKKAVEFVQAIGFENIRHHEQELLNYVTTELKEKFQEKIHLLGDTDKKEKVGLVSFTLDGVHPHDIATLLGEKNICVRAGEHCASFLHRAINIPATTRISFGIYTSKSDIDVFIEALVEIYQKLRKP